MSKSIRQYLNESALYLPHSVTAKLDLEVLLQYVLKVSQAYLYAHPHKVLTTQEKTVLDKLLVRRKVGEPMAYITGEKEFFSLPLKVTPDVLVPRPETELLVELALQLLPKTKTATVADLGTGSGAIALALAHHRPHWNIYATDLSSAALLVARENAKQLRLTSINFLQSHWCDALPDKKFDIIVSNPPYIDAADGHLKNGELAFEPRAALVAAQEGLADFCIITRQAGKFLHKGGWLLLEHGCQQAERVANYLREQGFSDISTQLDLAGLARVTLAKC